MTPSRRDFTLTSLLFLLPLAVGSCEVSNSFSGDKVLASGNTSPALQALGRNCISCHQHADEGWADYKSIDDYVTADLVVKGSLDESYLWSRIADGSMPLQPAQLPADDREAIKQWILGTDVSTASVPEDTD